MTFSDFYETRSICKSDAFEKNQNNIVGYKDIDLQFRLKTRKTQNSQSKRLSALSATQERSGFMEKRTF